METSTKPAGRIVEKTSDWRVRPLSRHDAVLLSIPLLYLAGLLVSVASRVSLETGLLVGSFGSALVIADALFVHPPAT